MNSSNKKRIVILGGGYTGLRLLCLLERIKGISDLAEITLIDKKVFFECNLASVNFLVYPQRLNGLVREYSHYLKEAKFICGDVDVVTPTHVTVSLNVPSSPSSSSSPSPSSLSVGEQIGVSYDILLVCTGTHYPLFKPDQITIAERTQEVLEYSEKVRDAEHILIVGGRGVGVEMVGSIIEEYPEKRITIVHSRGELMDIWPSSGIEKLKKFLKRVIESDGNMHKLSDGSIVEADLKIITCGATPNTQMFKTHFASAINEQGYLKVRPSLQFEDYDNIFALGDVADAPMNKNAVVVKIQVGHAISCIQKILNGKKAGDLTSSFNLSYPFGITLGSQYAIMAVPLFGGISFGGALLGRQAENAFKRIVQNPHK